MVGPRHQDPAHGIENARQEREVRVAVVSGILFQHRGKQEALEEDVRLVGGQVDSVTLADAANTSLILLVQMPAFGPVRRFVDCSVGKSPRRVCAVQKYVELLS